MWWCGPAVALWGALLVAHAAAYTVDCNHEYADCDTEIVKTRTEDEASNQELSATTMQHYILPDTTESIQTTETQTNQPEKQKERDYASSKPEPRLINLNVEDLQKFANSLHNQTLGEERTHKKIFSDLSDVNLDEDEEEYSAKTVANLPAEKSIPNQFYTNLEAPFHPLLTMEIPDETDVCKESGVTYKAGERIERGCEETCECTINGVFDCVPRCTHPYIRRGRRLNDPLCFETPVDDCCSIVACTTNADPKVSAPICRYGNETYAVGSTWNVECEKVCKCENNSVVNCRARCNPLKQSDKCINVQDPNDSCCEIQVCDVSQDAHEEPMDNSSSIFLNSTTSTPMSLSNEDVTEPDEYPELSKMTRRPLVLTEPIGSVVVLHNNSVQVNLMHLNDTKDPIHLLLSDDGGKSFRDVVLEHSNLILNLRGGRDYILKTKETGTKFNFTITASGDSGNLPNNNNLFSESMIGCHHNDKFYSVGEEFLIGCTEICECTGLETRECAALECPSHVGLELVSKGCVRWAPSPPAQPPNCCPRAARCLSDGTCHYKGIAIPNWTEVPLALSGCEERCFCENGELDCQEICTPLPEVPPQTLRCPPMHKPTPVNVSDDDCCKKWGCAPNHYVTMLPDLETSTNPSHIDKPFLPTTLPGLLFPQELPDYEQNNIHRPVHTSDLSRPDGDVNKKLTVITINADSPTSIKMLLGLSPVLVGLSGSVDLRYTDKADEDISHWSSQVFAPADEILTTSRLEFRLTGLKPSTMYKIRAKLYLHNLPFEPESDVFSVRTNDLPSMVPEEEKRREIDSRLTVVDVNDTTAHVSWRHFTEDELQYIDGIQVRYRPVGTPIYLMTELLHHSRSSAELQDLRPSSKYEASLVLIPPPRSLTELNDPQRVEFTTLPYMDPYNWSVTIEVRTVGSEAAELTWHGVPAPAERWVRVYRAAHACQNDPRRENDAFKLAARDLSPVVTLTGLKPDTRCRVWLELFLTNGKVKTSNVIEINTKSLDSPEPIDNEIAQSSMADGRGAARSDYYGALVVVGVVAALGAVTSLLLLLVVVRRHRPRSVPITPVPSAPRESSLPPYDNPAYKLELQQETMDL